MKIGAKVEHAHAVERPKDMYSVGSGILERMPVASVHMPGVRTKVSRRIANTLIGAVTDVNSSESSSDEGSPDSTTPNNKGSMTVYINDLIEAMKRESLHASRQGSRYSFTQRAERMLRKAAVIAIKGAIRDMVDAWIDRLGDDEKEAAMECMSTPAINNKRNNAAVTELERRIIFPTASTDAPRAVPQQPPIITPPVDLTADEDGDESDIDIVLTEMKEETMLQNLLHKRLMKNNQRVLTLEHKNGRKFRVMLPPDSQSTKAFVDDARKTQWINDMLHADTHQEGMLQCLATARPETCLLYTSPSPRD